VRNQSSLASPLAISTTSTPFEVLQVTPTVSQWPTASAITYGQSLVSSTLSGGSASYNGNNVSGKFTWTTSGTVPNVGTPSESVTFTPTSIADYAAVSNSIGVSVNPAVLTITASSPTVAFGSAVPAITPAYSGFVHSDTASVLTAAPSCSTTYTPTSPAGSSPSTSCSGAATTNYTIGYVSGSVTVNKASQTITFKALASPVSYGVVPITLSASSSSGLTVSFSATGSCSVSGSSLTITGGGKCKVTASQAGNGNYAVASVDQTIQVNPEQESLNWATPAAITYGTPLSTTQLDASAGSIKGSFAYSPASGTVLGVGSHKLTVTFTPNDSTDYATVTSNVSLVVNPVQLTVTANAASRAYGAANPVFTAAFSGFVNGDSAAKAVSGSPSFTTTATARSAPGNYPIVVALGSLAAANYTFKFVAGTLAVTRAPLTVAANSVSVPYDQAIPKLTYTVKGFVNGDTSSLLRGTPVESSTAIKGSNYGTYPIAIAQGTLTANSNYSFQFVNGTLTITPLGSTVKPSFRPGSETSTGTLSVTISDATANAAIYYTTNRNAPTISSTRYTTAIKVSATETLQAIAVAPGYTPSGIGSATYTIATAPTVTTKPATGLSTSGAILNATVSADNASTEYWFAYGTSEDTLTSTTTKVPGLAGTTATPVSAKLTGLKTKTKYYFKAVASNAVGTASGAVLSFTTN
jgi:hypothetical protein